MMAGEIQESIRKKNYNLYDMYVFNIQETKDAGGLWNALKSGTTTNRYDIDWLKIMKI